MTKTNKINNETDLMRTYPSPPIITSKKQEENDEKKRQMNERTNAYTVRDADRRTDKE